MASLLSALIATSSVASSRTEKEGVLYITNPSVPAEGQRMMQTTELWRVGSLDSDILLGYVSKVIGDEDGNVYVLDGQMRHVLVLSAQGELSASLSREGEGPGEIQRPVDLFQISDGVLGIVEGFPAQIVLINLEGVPLPSIFVGKDGSRGLGNLQEGKFRSGRLVLFGQSQEMHQDGLQITEYLGKFSLDGTEEIRYLDKSYLNNLAAPSFNEMDRYFVNNGRWTLGPDGYVYTAPLFSEYEIHVFNDEGKLTRVIQRDFESRPRSKKELTALSKGPAMMVDGRRVSVKSTVEDRDPCVKSLRADENGALWVLNSWGDRDQEPGVFITYDVFDSQGEFRKRVSLRMEGDPRTDLIFWVDDDHLAVVQIDSEDETSEEGAPLELIYYQIE
ncbi:MAG: hypothetical protein KOO60_00730 [Gemmatimonadales bacterium]|nr:hypothetical protein [Gemmatimonadales bacterium]